MPKLIVLPLTDSFSALWPALAAELGLALVTVDGPQGFARQTDAVGIVAAGGAEEMLEAAFHDSAGSGGGIAIVAVGALPSHRVASTVVRAGADSYLALPDDQQLLRSWLNDRATALRARAQASAFAAGERSRYRFDGILGDSPTLRAALDRAARVIPHGGVTVLLTGETGTGKELVARAIHYNGPRREAPFVDVNCAAIPDQLLESELFGHEKGAFTDASATKPGLFELADGGTLFLDEIGHLPLSLQGKLLRALEERVVRRIGGTQGIAVDVRIIAATHVDLASASKRGEFRQDLYHRLNVVPIELPPLRHRRNDIVPIAKHFLSRFARDYGITEPVLSRAAEQALKERDWSGNVRELRNMMERSVLLASRPVLEAEDFADDARTPAAEGGALPFPATLAELSRAAVEAMLGLTAGNKSVAARRLGISRPRLQRLLDTKPEDASASNDNSDDEAQRDD